MVVKKLNKNSYIEIEPEAKDVFPVGSVLNGLFPEDMYTEIIRQTRNAK